MKDTFYFSHDYNARQDDKVKRLIMKHGFLGYGIFWAIVENLYNNANALRLDCELIAYEMRTTENVIESIINDFDLFIIDGDYFGSLSVERRLNERDKKSKKASESASIRWNKLKEDANALQTECECNPIKERKGDESKGEEKKEVKIYRKFAHLKISFDEVEKIKAQGYLQNQIDGILDSIENYKKNTSYTSLYLTALKWLKKEYPSVVSKSTENIEYNYKFFDIPITEEYNFTPAQIIEFCKQGKYTRL